MTGATLTEVAASLRSADSLLLMTHEHPDGDAIGSLVAAHRVLESAGIDAPIHVASDDEPAEEYRFMVPWDRVIREIPQDLSQTTLVMLDCGNLERSPARERGSDAAAIINLDHHHDNTNFGALNHVDAQASCTAEIVWRLAQELDSEIDRLTATALYVGLVTDTGRFMYDNTLSEAHIMAGDLIERGVPVADIFRRIYEGVPLARAQLLGRALGNIERHEEGQLTMTWLSRADFDETGAIDGWSEGVVDHLRAIEGTHVAAVVREPQGSPDVRRVSLRASTDRVDVSAIARAGGGGGHRGAAGFSSDLSHPDLVAFICEQIRLQTEAD